jgi:hypothetical protein
MAKELNEIWDVSPEQFAKEFHRKSEVAEERFSREHPKTDKNKNIYKDKNQINNGLKVKRWKKG